MDNDHGITDDLRRKIKGTEQFYGIECKCLTAIADRIDAEHETDVMSAMNDALYHANDESMAELGWLRLPKDAAGEYIHIGDVMEWVRYGDDDPTIVRTVIGVGSEVFFAWSDEQGRYAQYEAHAYRHHHAQTVEDVLREFAQRWDEPMRYDRNELVEQCAAKLQLKED